MHAFKITAIVAAFAVVLNTIFGVGAALLLVRHRFPRPRLLSALIDLPLAVSPVVVGLALILVYGRFAPVGGWLDGNGIQIIFALPGMVLATVFVSLPLVVRAVAPVLEEIGIEQEQAAWTLGARPVPDVPADHAARPSAGRSPTAWSSPWPGALGEFGAVAVVSGRLVGRDPDRDPVRRGAAPELRPDDGVRGVGRPGDHRRRHPPRDQRSCDPRRRS